MKITILAAALAIAGCLCLTGQNAQLAKVDLSAASGDIQIIAPVQPGTRIKIWKVLLSFAATTDITYIQGTGTNCATGKASLGGVMKTVQSIIDTAPQGMPVELAPGQAFCLTISSASTGGGYVIWSN